jgi:hypothetical protein
MTARSANSQRMTASAQLGRYVPRVLNRLGAWRLEQDRRARYTSQLTEPPTDIQSALIQSMIRVEKTALLAEAEGSLHAARIALDARRLLSRLQIDFYRTITPPPAKRKTAAERLAARTAAPSITDLLAARDR